MVYHSECTLPTVTRQSIHHTQQSYLDLVRPCLENTPPLSMACRYTFWIEGSMASDSERRPEVVREGVEGEMVMG